MGKSEPELPPEFTEQLDRAITQAINAGIDPDDLIELIEIMAVFPDNALVQPMIQSLAQQPGMTVKQINAKLKDLLPRVLLDTP